MKEKQKSKPPYPSTGQADEILDIFRRISPKKIDSKFVAENRIATAPNASSVVNFVKWMGITDEENNVKEDIANKLRLVGEERDKFILSLIKLAYEDVLSGVNLEQARRDDLTNFFINTYHYGPAPAKGAAILLLHLCEKYGIPISEEIKKKTYTNLSNEKRSERKSSEKVEKTNYAKKTKIDDEKKTEGIIIHIPNSGLKKEYTINNKEEFENVFGAELEKVSKIVKILFDWE